jgi:hypothetical protein
MISQNGGRSWSEHAISRVREHARTDFCASFAGSGTFCRRCAEALSRLEAILAPIRFIDAAAGHRLILSRAPSQLRSTAAPVVVDNRTPAAVLAADLSRRARRQLPSSSTDNILTVIRSSKDVAHPLKDFSRDAGRALGSCSWSIPRCRRKRCRSWWRSPTKPIAQLRSSATAAPAPRHRAVAIHDWH